MQYYLGSSEHFHVPKQVNMISVVLDYNFQIWNFVQGYARIPGHGTLPFRQGVDVDQLKNQHPKKRSRYCVEQKLPKLMLLLKSCAMPTSGTS